MAYIWQNVSKNAKNAFLSPNTINFQQQSDNKLFSAIGTIKRSFTNSPF